MGRQASSIVNFTLALAAWPAAHAPLAATDVAEHEYKHQMLTTVVQQNNKPVLISIFLTTSFPRRPKTSVLSALARKALVMKAPRFTASFPTSCFRVEILPAAT